MGANQSTGSGSGGNAQQAKRCYYEVLDVDRQASDDEYGTLSDDVVMMG